MCLTPSIQRKYACEGRKLMKFLYLNQSYFLPSSLIEKDVSFPQTIKQYPCCLQVGSTCVSVILLEIEVLISVYLYLHFSYYEGDWASCKYLCTLDLLYLFFMSLIFSHSFKHFLFIQFCLHFYDYFSFFLTFLSWALPVYILSSPTFHHLFPGLLHLCLKLSFHENNCFIDYY